MEQAGYGAGGLSEVAWSMVAGYKLHGGMQQAGYRLPGAGMLLGSLSWHGAGRLVGSLRWHGAGRLLGSVLLGRHGAGRLQVPWGGMEQAGYRLPAMA